jgi:hypothetical protein
MFEHARRHAIYNFFPQGYLLLCSMKLLLQSVDAILLPIDDFVYFEKLVNVNISLGNQLCVLSGKSIYSTFEFILGRF